MCPWASPFAGKILDVSVSPDGLLLCTTSEDKALKVFDVVNFGKTQLKHIVSGTNL